MIRTHEAGTLRASDAGTTVTLAGWAELTLTMAMVLIAVDLIWTVAAAQARRLLKSARAMRIANRVSATTMSR